MEHLLADNDGLATSSALLNATTEMERKLSATAAQQFLKLLLKEKWLEQVVSVTCTSRFDSLTQWWIAAGRWGTKGTIALQPRYQGKFNINY